MSSFFSNRILIIGAIACLSGCAVTTPQAPEDVRERYSSAYPVRTMTSFTEGLVCMDRMFAANKVEPIYITAAPIPDYSENRGGAGYAARDMLISAISEMTRNSAAIRFVAFDRQTPDIVALQSTHPKRGSLRIPDFFIRGAVTQINNTPYSKQIGDSLSIAGKGENFLGGGLGTSASLTLSSVSLDMAVGLVNNYQMLPGIFSANTFSVEKRSNSDELSISLKRIGAVFSVNENQAEALSLALRGLVEVGTIELFGKLYNLPYWECLAEIGDNAPMREAARSRYAEMSVEDRMAYVAAQLVKEKLLAEGAPLLENGGYSPQLSRAVMQYRMQQNVLGSGVVDYPLFERIFTREQRVAILAQAASPGSAAGMANESPAATPAAPAPEIRPGGSPAPDAMRTPPAPDRPLLEQGAKAN